MNLHFQVLWLDGVHASEPGTGRGVFCAHAEVTDRRVAQLVAAIRVRVVRYNLVLVNQFTLAPISQTALSGVLYGQTVIAGLNTRLPTGVTIEEAVLLAPAALTHHDDGGQRCIPLLVQDDISFPHGSARVTMPASAQHAPPGWYMLFVLTNAGIPSNAVWINLR
ncbi:MAG: DUF1929 domain-containing protein [Planctomycetes bacterium]|nr:DUF1929 domain-containing protein [Planctomycetota bacterium]